MNLLDPFIIVTLFILIYSAILHEMAHGFVADRLGDPTARLLGRLTLDPRPHIDPIMSIALPMLLIITGSPIIFGGAKPVPIDPFNLKEGRKDIALVSLAGPLTNIILAIMGTVIFTLLFKEDYSLFDLIFRRIPLQSFTDIAAFIFAQIISLNVLLAIFNLLPIPPLDGSKVFALLLPEKTAHAYLSIGNLGAGLILFLLLLPTGLSTLIGILYRFCLSLLGF
ncbi:MAG: site-2 protease family protein [Candidatus Levybacteria bacterium]|nr:site-2 protease family protein [Candidatus Levybacteria bacterium]